MNLLSLLGNNVVYRIGTTFVEGFSLQPPKVWTVGPALGMYVVRSLQDIITSIARA